MVNILRKKNWGNAPITMNTLRRRKLRKCTNYGGHSEEEKLRKRAHYGENSQQEAAKKWLKVHLTPMKERQESRRVKYNSEKHKTQMEPREFHLELYLKECRNTPIFPCICCHWLKFPKGVKVFILGHTKINPGLLEKSCKFNESFKVRGCFYLCINCHWLLTNETRLKGL